MPPSSRSLRFAQSLTLLSGAALAAPALPAVALTGAALALEACGSGDYGIDAGPSTRDTASVGVNVAPDVVTGIDAPAQDVSTAGAADAPTQDVVSTPDADVIDATAPPDIVGADVPPSPDGGGPG